MKKNYITLSLAVFLVLFLAPNYAQAKPHQGPEHRQPAMIKQHKPTIIRHHRPSPPPHMKHYRPHHARYYRSGVSFSYNTCCNNFGIGFNYGLNNCCHRRNGIGFYIY